MIIHYVWPLYGDKALLEVIQRKLKIKKFSLLFSECIQTNNL